MAILGSRERMCIHPQIVPRDGIGKKTRDVSHSCRIRVKNTEKYRRHAKKSMNENYSDDDPPPSMLGDDVDEVIDENDESLIDDEETEKSYMSKSFKTCPHYRELSRASTASSVITNFFPGQNINSIDKGGEASRLGTHDIEDLVSFGKDPHIVRGVALYRRKDYDGFGLTLKQGVCHIQIQKVKEKGPADIEGTARKDDIVTSVNGKSSNGWSMKRMVEEVQISGDIMLLDLQREKDDLRSACPYYLSRTLAKTAELTFAPYNYVLDPSIRKSLDIDISGSIIILDEAHNIESTLRESGSGSFSEIDLCELLVFLNTFLRLDRSEKASVSSKYSDTSSEIPEEKSICDIVHNILTFIENIILLLRGYRKKFEVDPGKNILSKKMSFVFDCPSLC